MDKNGLLTIKSGTTEIKNLAYYGDKSIKKVIIPSSVKTIGKAAFQNCKSLTKVTLHEGLANLSYRLFKGTALKEITIPASVTDIGAEVFNDCKNLTAIKVAQYSKAHTFFSSDSRLASPAAMLRSLRQA